MISHNNQNINLNEDIEWRNNCIGFILPGIFFLLFPLIGCILSILITFYLNKKRFVKISFAYIFIFLVLIQSQRIVKPLESGDWKNYIDFYNSAKSIYFISTFEGSKDIVYTLWNFCGNIIFGNYSIAFLDFTLDIELLLLGLSSYRLWKYSKYDARYGICSICIALLFSEILISSNNLLRQQFATSIMMYGISLRYTNSHKWIVFLIWSVLTHSMTIILIPLYFLHINEKPNKQMLRLILLIFISIFLLFIIGPKYLMGSSIYIIQRIASGEVSLFNDTINPSAIYPFAFAMGCIYYKHYFLDKKCDNVVWIGCNTIIYICILCIITISLPMFVTRIYITRLAFISIVIPYIFTNRTLYNSLFQILIILIFILRFSTVNSEYLNIGDYALSPFLSLL